MTVALEGVRFRLFPDWAEDPLGAETIALTLPVGLVGPGPTDPWMRTVDALGKTQYDPPRYGPPYRGPRGAPALPNRRGHFDHIAFDDPTFASAHLYGAARFALDVWEKYLGRKVRWRSANVFPQLELIPRVDWDNAQSGPGFLETGARRTHAGELQPFCMNFDVIAHEMGHTILFAEIGVPPPERLTSEFLAFHEAMSDMSALVAIMHFDGVLDSVLRKTHGNLYVLNMLNRFGILSGTEQIRVCDNMATMADVAGLRLGAARSWALRCPPVGSIHSPSAPLTGAIFDLLVELFQNGLLARGVIEAELDVRRWPREENEERLQALSARFKDRFDTAEPLFRDALQDARDLAGAALARTFETLSPYDLTFDEVAHTFLRRLDDVCDGADLPLLAENFTWRGIGSGMSDLDTRFAKRRAQTVTPPYAIRVAAARMERARADDGAFNAGVLHQLINHDHREHPHGER